MERKKKELRLYNVLFPLWLILLFPQTWLIVLPGNFIIDSLVLIVGMFIWKIAEKKQWYKRYIIKIYLFGMLSDMIGAGYMLLLMLCFDVGRMGDEFYLTVPALVISAALIFIFNYFITFRKEEKQLRVKVSLLFAIVTAPYTFLVPSSWIY